MLFLPMASMHPDSNILVDYMNNKEIPEEKHIILFQHINMFIRITIMVILRNFI